MADVSKIALTNGEIYDIKDATARSGIMPYGSTSGTSSAYTVSLSEVTSLTVGMVIAVLFNQTNDAGATLNVNSLGAKPIYYNTSAISSGAIPSGSAVTLLYADNKWYITMPLKNMVLEFD